MSERKPRTIVLELDEADYDTIQREIAHRQARMRDAHGTILPDGDSNLAGAILAEVVRDIEEYRSLFESEGPRP